MLGPIRKFSTSIYAKILLAIIIIPFVFWGMGSSITGGNKNIVVTIDKDKYSTQQLGDFIQKNAPPNQKVKADEIESFLSSFIGEKLMEKEIDFYGIKLTDNSLSKIIKYQKNFQKNDKFSRTEYEKFLLLKNITAVDFESILSSRERKKQLLDLISGGIRPAKFHTNIAYDKINQKRNIELINLDKVYKEKISFTNDELIKYYEKNKDRYKETYNSVNILKLTPKILAENDEYNDLFFKKIDEINDLIIAGENLNSIIIKFNLNKPNFFKINRFGLDFKTQSKQNINKDLVKLIFGLNNSEPTTLIENENNYIIIQLLKSENIVKDINNESFKKEIVSDLRFQKKEKLILELINKINEKTFSKNDFKNFSTEENNKIQKIRLENQNDNKILSQDIINQVFATAKNDIIVASESLRSKNFLIYIDKIDNVKINEDTEDIEKYTNLAKFKIITNLYNTYDSYIKKRYDIEINYQALDIVKNYFN